MITVVKNCGGGRRRLVDEFTVEVQVALHAEDVVAGNTGVTVQTVAAAAQGSDGSDGLTDGQDGFSVTEVGRAITSALQTASSTRRLVGLRLHGAVNEVSNVMKSTYLSHTHLPLDS